MVHDLVSFAPLCFQPFCTNQNGAGSTRSTLSMPAVFPTFLPGVSAWTNAGWLLVLGVKSQCPKNSPPGRKVNGKSFLIQFTLTYSSYCITYACVTLLAVPRNYDPALHPFEVAREYVRALNATKLERVFAKPFLSSLDGHRDGVNCIVKHPKSLSTVLSGACDGEVSSS